MVRLNEVLKCYVIEENDQKDFLTFDECIQQGNRFAGWLRARGQHGVQFIPFDLRGTEEAFTRYCELRERASRLAASLGLSCPTELSNQLRGLEGRLVRAEDHDGPRWFLVGLSDGWLPRHVELRQDFRRSVSREHVYRCLMFFRCDRNFHYLSPIGDYDRN
jgi:hypothetical protein